MKTKTAGVEQYLLNRITGGEYAPHAKIPSQFKLMQHFSCSRVTVQRALNNLIRAGILYSSRGSGTFVRPGPYNGRVQELVIVSQYADNSPDFPFSEMLFNLQTPLPIRWVDEEFFDRNPAHFCHPGQAVIWLLPGEKQIMHMYHLRQRNIPQLLINRTYGDFDFVSTDPWSSIREGLNLLAVRRGDSFAVVSRIPNADAPYLSERLLAFYEECFNLGLNIPPDGIIKRNLSEFSLDSSSPEIFPDGRIPRRIFIPEELLLAPVIMNASRYNRILGKDYEILVFSQGILIPPRPGLLMMHQPMDEFRQQIEKFIIHINSGSKERFQIRIKTVLRGNG
ncbi:MAG: GntR family transcriptional regulator [Lentisphaeria bacterium]|nr:GntR family transcriptional regulator [Lentisphaeria bacterium]